MSGLTGIVLMQKSLGTSTIFRLVVILYGSHSEQTNTAKLILVVFSFL